MFWVSTTNKFKQVHNVLRSMLNSMYPLRVDVIVEEQL